MPKPKSNSRVVCAERRLRACDHQHVHSLPPVPELPKTIGTALEDASEAFRRAAQSLYMVL